MVYYFLPTGKLHKKTYVTKLNNLHSNFETGFYKNWLDNVNSSFDSNSKEKLFMKQLARVLKIICLLPTILASI